MLVHIEASASLMIQADFSGKIAMHFAAAAGHCDVIHELATMESSYLQAEDNEERSVKVEIVLLSPKRLT